jgi:hypothetical protein
MNRTALTALCLWLGVSSSAFAHDVDMKTKTRELGLSVGNAYVRAAAADKVAFKADSEAIYDRILHDLGPSLAYVYAVSAGFGASLDVDGLDCAKLAKHWSGTKTKFELEGTK